MTSYPPVKQLDHMIVRSDDPKRLFTLFTETFQLPIAWPLGTYPSFTSGGVTLGNLYLELLSCGPFSRDARFVAIAYESADIWASVRELKRRKVPHGPVVPYIAIEPDGSKTKHYSNAILGKMVGRDFWIDSMIRMGKLPGSASMSNAGAGGAMVRFGVDKVMRGKLIFLVEYAYGNFKELPQWSEFESHDEKRASDKATLDARGGGPLGVRSAKEIILGVKDVAEAKERWRRFLSPNSQASDDSFEIADGPAVRLIQSNEDGIQSLVINVESLEAAAAFLEKNGMKGEGDGDHLTIARDKVYGLDIQLTDSSVGS